MLNGLDYQECFGFTPQVTKAHPFHNKSINDGFSIRYNRGSLNISITHDLVNAIPVSITLFDIRGKKVAELVNTVLAAGTHNYMVNLKSQIVSSGVYFVSCTAGEKTFRKQLYIVK